MKWLGYVERGAFIPYRWHSELLKYVFPDYIVFAATSVLWQGLGIVTEEHINLIRRQDDITM